MGDVFVRYLPLPCTVKGLTVQDDAGDYNVYLNARLNHESHIETLQHEIKHIFNGDFQKLINISDIEK